MIDLCAFPLIRAISILESGMNPFGSHVLEKLLLSLQRLHGTAQEAVERCFVSFAAVCVTRISVQLASFASLCFDIAHVYILVWLFELYLLLIPFALYITTVL